jgi:Tol biopolymer transport system component
MAWWSPDSREINYLDGSSGELASVTSVGLDGTGPHPLYEGLPNFLSASDQYQVSWRSNTASVLRLADKVSWSLTMNAWPSISPGGQWLLWQYSDADNVPNFATPSAEVWIARLNGGVAQLLMKQPAGALYWLDDDRFLSATREDKPDTTDVYDLSIHTISTGQNDPLTKLKNLRGLSVAPGGKSIMYYTPFLDDPHEDGIYLLATKSDAVPVKMPFFGSWRWRDSNSIILIPFDPGQPMSFVLYDVNTSQNRPLTDPKQQPFEIANDDWSVSPDGRYILFWSAKDYALWSVSLTS